MSIIYDALKKVEKSANRDIITEVNKERSGNKLISYLLYALVVCAGLFLANAIFAVFSVPQSTLKPEAPLKAIMPSKAIEQPAVAGKSTAFAPAVIEVKKAPEIPPLLLNGVFYSKNEGYAIINNRVVKQGDFVDGVKVRKVSLEDVELETSGGLTFKLSTQSR
jgi:hypothetical protein